MLIVTAARQNHCLWSAYTELPECPQQLWLDTSKHYCRLEYEWHHALNPECASFITEGTPNALKQNPDTIYGKTS